jgi:hypothetical protein
LAMARFGATDLDTACRAPRCREPPGKPFQARADSRAADIAPVIAELQASGAASLRAIADGLNARKIPTARGNGEWSAVQVQRVLERLDPFVDGGASEASRSAT